jgi:hypothetical protein
MYAFDITSKCFHKQVAARSNHHYPALVYLCVNNHMFLIDKDAKTSEGHNYVQSLIKQAREIEVNVKSCLVDEENQQSKTNIFDLQLPIIENIPIQDLHKYNDHIIMYQKSDLNDELKDIIRYHSFIPAKHQMRYKNFKCVKIHYTKNKMNIYLLIDPNPVHQIDYKDIQKLCEVTNMPFKNQSLSVLVKDLREKFEQPVRHIFTPEERQQMFNDANGVCE